jgi:hypothetical protein
MILMYMYMYDIMMCIICFPSLQPPDSKSPIGLLPYVTSVYLYLVMHIIHVHC